MPAPTTSRLVGERGRILVLGKKHYVPLPLSGWTLDVRRPVAEFGWPHDAYAGYQVGKTRVSGACRLCIAHYRPNCLPAVGNRIGLRLDLPLSCMHIAEAAVVDWMITDCVRAEAELRWEACSALTGPFPLPAQPVAPAAPAIPVCDYLQQSAAIADSADAHLAAWQKSEENIQEILCVESITRDGLEFRESVRRKFSLQNE